MPSQSSSIYSQDSGRGPHRPHATSSSIYSQDSGRGPTAHPEPSHTNSPAASSRYSGSGGPPSSGSGVSARPLPSSGYSPAHLPSRSGSQSSKSSNQTKSDGYSSVFGSNFSGYGHGNMTSGQAPAAPATHTAPARPAAPAPKPSGSTSDGTGGSGPRGPAPSSTYYTNTFIDPGTQIGLSDGSLRSSGGREPAASRPQSAAGSGPGLATLFGDASLDEILILTRSGDHSAELRDLLRRTGHGRRER